VVGSGGLGPGEEARGDSAKPIVDRAPSLEGEKVGAMMKLQDAQGGRLATFGAGGERAVRIPPYRAVGRAKILVHVF
jgi:hypothetical protein